MKTFLLPLAAILCAIACRAAAADLALTSKDISPGGKFPSRFTCDGKNVSPNLTITGIPANARSLVLILDDPDAPGGTFTHWLLWNIPIETKDIAEGALPRAAVQGVNDFGKLGYGGPCPPSGEHRYIFHLYALDTELALPANAKRRQVDAGIAGHIIAKAKLQGTYSK
jgi:hypothetical protein